MAPEVMAIIQRSLDSIESRLRTEISVDELAAEACFSRRQFEHVFRAATGMSVGRYVTRRRLLHAVRAMHCGARAIDAALDWGFDTHAGFWKAFRREFGCSPSAWKRTHRAARPARVNLTEVTVMDREIIARALHAWGLEASPKPVYYANTGRASENTFAVDDRYYVKVSARPGEMRRQAALNRSLDGLTARVIPTLAGEDVYVEAGVEFLLLEWLPGTPAQAEALLTDPAQATALGEGLARLHDALRRCDPLLCHAEDFAATLRDWAVPAVRAVLDDAPWMEQYLRRVERTFPLLPAQIIHRDPNPDNVLMQDGRVTGFLDFELTRVMPRIFDLCYAATGMLSVTWQEEALRPRFFEAVRTVWQGYDGLSPLTEAEKSALPDMVTAIQLTCVAAFAGSDQYKTQFETNRAMLTFVLAHQDQLTL